MMLLCLSASRIYNTFRISTRSRKKKIGCCSLSFLVHPGRSPGMMLLCQSASGIYNTFSVSTRSRKKKLGCCSISFLVHPGRSPGMMLLCLSASRIYNTLAMKSTADFKMFFLEGTELFFPDILFDIAFLINFICRPRMMT